MIASAAQHVCAALACVLALGCQPTANVGTLREAGMRCDPLGSDCGDAMACTVRSDPAMDACRPVGALAVGAPCTALDTCVAHAQCARIGDATASLDPADLSFAARCVQVCARDAPACDAAERCTDVRDGDGGTRVDFGLCAP